MIGFEEAVALTLAAGELLGIEAVPLRQAHRRVLAEPVIARIDSPRADVSSMDGYAVREGDLVALPAALRIAGASYPGQPFAGVLPPQSCVRLFTGAPVPDGADRIVVQEVVTTAGDLARFAQPFVPARHIRAAASDFASGEQLLTPGTLLTAGALVAAAGADVAEVRVARRPLIHLLGTGDELVEPGQARSTPNAIPESVSVGVAALAEDWGGTVSAVQRLPDELARMEQAAADALESADLVVVTGGASVGQKDFAKAMFEPAKLELIFAKVSIKPGKPVWFGRARGCLVLGLPGNPASALVTARLFLAPLLCRLTGRDPADALAWRGMALGHPLEPTGDRETFSRGYVEGDVVHLFGHQDSNGQKVLGEARLLVRRAPGHQPLPHGTRVDVLDL